MPDDSRSTSTSHNAGAGSAVDSGIPAVETVTLSIDGRQVTAPKGQMLIEAAEEAGVYIPRFCYHPRMKSVGVCRMCLVEVSGPRGATLQPSCFIAVADGQEVVTDSEKVKKAQDGVLEFLLINHPLDCPVCDKGGECPLQDQTLSYGPGETRFFESKRHWAKPIPISDLVLLDRERCIQCSRCTRFADEVAGEPLIDFYSRGDQIEVATFPDSPFASYFSGNTVQICPVGALTATPYRFAARPWDLAQVESTCTSCSVGCRVVVQSSADQVIRYLGVDSDPVNQSWMCDKGRFDFESLREESRVTSPMIKKGGELVEVSWPEAIGEVSKKLNGLISSGGSSIAVIGGARLTNEGCYAWAKFAKSVAGTDSVDCQLGDGLDAALVLGAERATIEDATRADLVITLSGDLREELPVLFLRLREAAIAGSTKILELSPVPTAISEYATESLRYIPGGSAELAKALVADGEPQSIAGAKPQPVAGVAADDVVGARSLIAGLGGDASVVVVLGRPSLAEDASIVAAAFRAISNRLPNVKLLPALRRGNVLGALDAGMAPGVLPGRVSLSEGAAWYSHSEVWGSSPAQMGLGTEGILSAMASSQGSSKPIEALFLVGSDPMSDFPDSQLASKAMMSDGVFKVAVTSHLTESAKACDVVLPAASYAEQSGTTTNIEGRVSTLSQKVTAPGLAWADWVIVSEIAASLGSDLGFESAEDVWDEMERVVPLYRALTRQVLSSSAGANGVVVPLPSTGVPIPSRRRSIDPMSTPGIGSVVHQVPKPLVPPFPDHSAEMSGSKADVHVNEEHPQGPTRPAYISLGLVGTSGAVGTAGAADIAAGKSEQAARSGSGEPTVPPVDSYSFRLHTYRKLYDLGTAVGASPSLAKVADEGKLSVNPSILDKLGVSDGGKLKVMSNRGSLALTVHADANVPKGVAAIPFNVDLTGQGETVSALIDVSEAVTDVRLEVI